MHNIYHFFLVVYVDKNKVLNIVMQWISFIILNDLNIKH